MSRRETSMSPEFAAWCLVVLLLGAGLAAVGIYRRDAMIAVLGVLMMLLAWVAVTAQHRLGVQS